MPVFKVSVQKKVPIPDEVTGPRGTLTRNFSHALVTLTKYKNSRTGKCSIKVEKCMSRKKKCSVVKTIAGHINNMFVGVIKGYRYKMKLVYAHFPINASVKNDGDLVELRNYIGQKHVHTVKMPKGVKITEPGAKDEYWIEGNDLEDVSHAASAIWQSCRVTDKDIRKFLDGVYVYAKGVMGEEKPI